MKVKVYEQDQKINTITDYSTKFIRKAKNLGGKWNNKNSTWEFDIKNKQYVLDALQKIFYENGTKEVERVNAIIDLQKYLEERNKEDFDDCIEIFNRSAGKRFYRDSKVKLNDGCIILEGDLANRGGSMKYPQIGSVKGVILKMSDIPRQQVNEEIKKYNLTCITIEEIKDDEKEITNNVIDLIKNELTIEDFKIITLNNLNYDMNAIGKILYPEIKFSTEEKFIKFENKFKYLKELNLVR